MKIPNRSTNGFYEPSRVIDLNEVLDVATNLKGASFFSELVESMAKALSVTHASISEAQDSGFHVIALYTRGRIHRDVPLEYDASPSCLKALNEGYACLATGLKRVFPDTQLYRELDVDSYMGIGLRGEDGAPLGNLCLLDDGPIDDVESLHAALRIFALRATTELERLRWKRQLHDHVKTKAHEAQVRNRQRSDFLDKTTDIAQLVRVDDLRFEYVNPAWRDALGYDDLDLETLTLEDIVHPDTNNACIEHFTAPQNDASQSVQQCEINLRSKDGRTIVMEGNCCLRTEPGFPAVIQSIFRNITDQKEKQKEIRHLIHRTELGKKAANLGIWEWNPISGQLAWDDHMARLHHLNDGETVTNLFEWESRIHPQDRKAVQEFFENVAKTNRAEKVEFRILAPQNASRWLASHALRSTDDGELDDGLVVGVTRDITPRIQAESRQSALLGQLRDYKLALDETASVVQLSPTGSILRVNQRFVQLTGFKETDIAGAPYRELGLGVHEKECDDRIAHVLDSGKPHQASLKIQRSNGEDRWIESTLVPVMGAQGSIESILDIQIDISQRMVALRGLHEESAFRQQILDQMSDGLAVAHMCDNHPKLRFTIWNPRMREITGFDREDINRIGWIDALFQKSSPSWTAANAYSENKAELQELNNAIFSLITQKGDARIVSISTRILDNKTDRPALIFLMRDITSRTRAEEFQRQLIDAIGVAGEGIAIVEGDQFVFMNEEHANMFGYDSAQTCRALRWTQLYPKDVTERFEKEIFPELKEKKSWSGVVTAKRRKGGHFEQDINLRWVGDGRFIGVCQDITERRLAEQALRATNHQLELATKQKDRFVANMSHELRTPLNAILGLTEGLQAQVYGPVSKTQLTRLRSIEHSGQHLLALIEDILDIEKIEAGALQLSPEKVSAMRLVREASAIMAPVAHRRKIAIKTTALQGYDHYVYADPRASRQVIINLLSNAVKFSQDGGTVEVTVGCSPPGRPKPQFPGIDIKVIDRGIGIPFGKQEEIFKPFAQLGEVKDARNPGTGLGLTLVQNLMQLMDGDVHLESAPGIGSTFTVGFPAADHPSENGSPCSVDHQTTSVLEIVNDTVTLDIILAEDDLVSADSLKAYLEALGHRVDHVSRGGEVIGRIHETRPELVLLDIHLPEVNGLQILRMLRSSKETQNLPVIAITAAAMPSDRDTCLQAGANAYFAKPLRLSDLRTQIHEITSSSS